MRRLLAIRNEICRRKVFLYMREWNRAILDYLGPIPQLNTSLSVKYTTLTQAKKRAAPVASKSSWRAELSDCLRTDWRTDSKALAA